MSSFKINYDFRPYLPDLDIKNNIYNTSDSVNNNTNVDINTMIFIININEPIDSIYNDPKYLLFGVKNPLYNYLFPSLNFFSSQVNSNQVNLFEYDIISETNELTNETNNILNQIGYDLLNIDETQFNFMILETKENITRINYKIFYFYFNLKNYNESNEVNYNNYNSTLYYNDETHNVLIYPYYNYNELNPYIESPVKKYSTITEINQTNKFIESIDFNNKEMIRYYEKIDYKYFENIEYTMDQKTNMETLINYSNNIKNYVEYINEGIKNFDDYQIINISLNEISKMFYYSSNYNLKNDSTYTLTQLNNKHLNNYKTHSNQNNIYSFTMDKKISNINKGDNESKKYSSYYYFTNPNSSTLYQQIINYYVNFYYNISNSNSSMQMNKLNFFLHKILVYINPKIIDLNYLRSNVKTSIYPLFENSNILKFGTDDLKLELYIVGDIKQTNIYYINTFKIIFEFNDEVENKKFSFLIILSIAFYNNDFFSLTNTDSTKNTPLAYTNFSTIEESISLLPSIYSIKDSDNISKNTILDSTETNVYFYNTMNSFKNDESTRNYYYNINYYINKNVDISNYFISMYNFYDMIPNFISNLKTIDDNYYNNVINLLKTKLNYYIKNIIYIQNNYKIYTNYINKIKKYINYTGLFDENIVNNYKQVKYIEYFDHFPKISNDYLTIEQNYYGKYNQVLIYPYNDINITSFEVIPSGKYLKFNYINYSSLPYPSVVIEEFVKSIKSIQQIVNYYFSLFILLPYNINQDDDFFCSNYDYLSSTFKSNSTYSMGIGGNKSLVYLVLTDENNVPFNFYNNENNLNNGSNGINGINDVNSSGFIYGIKLFDYYNYESSNLKLQLLSNMFMNKYMNLSEFMLIFENFSDYSDVNNVLWDINNTNFQLHNFKSLKEIILYDFKRFNSNYDLNIINIQYSKFNYKKLEIIFENKVQLNNLKYCIKILIYLSNLYKILKLVQKILTYYEIVGIKIMFKDFNNEYILGIIKYNLGIISNLFQINYNLSITSGIFEKKIYDYISEMYNSNTNINLERINNFKTYCVYIINYSIVKIPSIINFVYINVAETTNIYHQIYYQIFKQITYENINYLLEEQIIYDVDNFTNNVDLNVFNGIFPNLDNLKKNLLLKLINVCIKYVAFNSTKIDELYNLAKLMANKQINELLPENLDNKVVKNNYIYNTTCYTNETNVPRFKIVDFLNNTIELIEKLSIPINNVEYENYQKSISEGILVFANNTINYFKEIINTIVEIYVNMRNLGIGIDINEPTQIGYFYNLLTLFNKNYESFFNILFQNKIDKFYEYVELKKSFDNLYQSSLEFLLYINLSNDFVNYDLNFLSLGVFLNEDLYKIIKIDSFYDFTIKTINNINNLVIYKNSSTTYIYIDRIKSLIEKKPLIYPNKLTITIIDKLLLELKKNISQNINTNDFVKYGSYYILPYEDLLLFKASFDWYSFNFNKEIIELIKSINSLNINIFEFYYNNDEITDFYKQALNYTYLNSPFEYINLNDVTN